jgi:hypothetical protein
LSIGRSPTALLAPARAKQKEIRANQLKSLISIFRNSRITAQSGGIGNGFGHGRPSQRQLGRRAIYMFSFGSCQALAYFYLYQVILRGQARGWTRSIPSALCAPLSHQSLMLLTEQVLPRLP